MTENFSQKSQIILDCFDNGITEEENENFISESK